MDRVNKQLRSKIMGMVGRRDTRPEVVVRRLLHYLGYRFRLHRKDLPGRPDIVLPKWKTIIFVHGCFWHRHRGCQKTTTPEANQGFWLAKFTQNIHRDTRNKRDLRRLGWRVLVVWECETSRPERLVDRLVRRLGFRS